MRVVRYRWAPVAHTPLRLVSSPLLGASWRVWAGEVGEGSFPTCEGAVCDRVASGACPRLDYSKTTRLGLRSNRRSSPSQLRLSLAAPPHAPL